jgi:3-dehydroquinate dehydratase-2
MKKIYVINGPNLNLLGKREPSLYGSETPDDIITELQKKSDGIEIVPFQSNHEGEIIDTIQVAGLSAGTIGIILNAGAYSHTSYAIFDAIKAITAPVIEVHITNIYARETFRRTSVLTPACAGVISGFGTFGYSLALEYLLKQQKPN